MGMGAVNVIGPLDTAKVGSGPVGVPAGGSGVGAGGFPELGGGVGGVPPLPPPPPPPPPPPHEMTSSRVPVAHAARAIRKTFIDYVLVAGSVCT